MSPRNRRAHNQSLAGTHLQVIKSKLGKEYFYYTDFHYDDFEWIGHKKKEMFNKRHIGLLYEIILAHMNAEADINGKKGAVEIYQNSVMKKSQYFKYSNTESELKKLYKKNK
jgi:hypothetical protein